jgi:hypothetical protein
MSPGNHARIAVHSHSAGSAAPLLCKRAHTPFWADPLALSLTSPPVHDFQFPRPICAPRPDMSPPGPLHPEGMDIGDAGATQLARALQANTTLTLLSFSYRKLPTLIPFLPLFVLTLSRPFLSNLPSLPPGPRTPLSLPMPDPPTWIYPTRIPGQQHRSIRSPPAYLP